MRPGAYAAEVLEVKAEQTPGSDVESLILTFPTIFDLISEKKKSYGDLRLHHYVFSLISHTF